LEKTRSATLRTLHVSDNYRIHKQREIFGKNMQNLVKKYFQKIEIILSNPVLSFDLPKARG